MYHVCSLAKRLQEQSVAFRHSQRRYLAEVQTQKSGGLAPEATLKFGIQFDSNSNGKSSSNTQSTSYINDNNSGNGFATSALVNDGFFATSQSQQVVLDDPLTIAVQSRDVEIIKIAQSIEELGSIFKELAVLVIDQGTILDRIDYNMEAVVEHTQTGIAQLEKAEKSQKNARPLRCIVCLSMTIFVLLTLLIIKHRPRRGWF